MEDRAQISAELLVVTAALLAVALLLIHALQTTAKGAESRLGSVAKRAINASGRI